MTDGLPQPPTACASFVFALRDPVGLDECVRILAKTSCIQLTFAFALVGSYVCVLAAFPPLNLNAAFCSLLHSRLCEMLLYCILLISKRECLC